MENSRSVSEILKKFERKLNVPNNESLSSHSRVDYNYAKHNPTLNGKTRHLPYTVDYNHQLPYRPALPPQIYNGDILPTNRHSTPLPIPPPPPPPMLPPPHMPTPPTMSVSQFLSQKSIAPPPRFSYLPENNTTLVANSVSQPAYGPFTITKGAVLFEPPQHQSKPLNVLPRPSAKLPKEKIPSKKALFQPPPLPPPLFYSKSSKSDSVSSSPVKKASSPKNVSTVNDLISLGIEIDQKLTSNQLFKLKKLLSSVVSKAEASNPSDQKPIVNHKVEKNEIFLPASPPPLPPDEPPKDNFLPPPPPPTSSLFNKLSDDTDREEKQCEIKPLKGCDSEVPTVLKALAVDYAENSTDLNESFDNLSMSPTASDSKWIDVSKDALDSSESLSEAPIEYSNNNVNNSRKTNINTEEQKVIERLLRSRWCDQPDVGSNNDTLREKVSKQPKLKCKKILSKDVSDPLVEYSEPILDDLRMMLKSQLKSLNDEVAKSLNHHQSILQKVEPGEVHDPYEYMDSLVSEAPIPSTSLKARLGLLAEQEKAVNDMNILKEPMDEALSSDDKTLQGNISENCLVDETLTKIEVYPIEKISPGTLEHNANNSCGAINTETDTMIIDEQTNSNSESMNVDKQITETKSDNLNNISKSIDSDVLAEDTNKSEVYSEVDNELSKSHTSEELNVKINHKLSIMRSKNSTSTELPAVKPIEAPKTLRVTFKEDLTEDIHSGSSSPESPRSGDEHYLDSCISNESPVKPNRPDLDSRLKQLFGIKNDANSPIKNAQKSPINQSRGKRVHYGDPTKLLIRPPSPFRSKELYHQWHKKTVFFYKNNVFTKESYCNPCVKQIFPKKPKTTFKSDIFSTKIKNANVNKAKYERDLHTSVLNNNNIKNKLETNSNKRKRENKSFSINDQLSNNNPNEIIELVMSKLLSELRNSIKSELESSLDNLYEGVSKKQKLN